MPGFFTTEFSNRLLDLAFGRRKAPRAVPEVLYLGVSLGPARRSGVVFEPSDLYYHRVPVPNVPSMFLPAEGGVTVNSESILLPAPRDDWGLIRSVFLADAPEGGLVIAMADLEKPLCVVEGDPRPTLLPGALYLAMGR